jgi:UDP-N-acetylmuramoyl-L-alanyl-D-glutamate--2,6-diaminopimelate ligase
MAASRSVGIDERATVQGIAALPGVPGRLEPVEEGQDFLVVVDYAHTPDSLENVLAAARSLTRGVRGGSSRQSAEGMGWEAGERTPRPEDGRVIVAFGCGGDRDRGKRPLMGRVATRLADLTFITSDNPRSEDPLAIVREIERGVVEGSAYVVEPDRRTAIGAAIREARAGDVVVIAGKGHETGQEFADRTIPFDDRLVAAEELRGMHQGVRS